MPYTQRRICPICGKPNLLKLSEHLRQVHDLSTLARQPWLKQASHHSPPTIAIPKDVSLSQLPIIIPPEDVPLHNSPVTDTFHSPRPCVDTQPHPDFAFQHPCSMMVVGPSQCGKTHFVHQLLTHKCIVYPNKKPWRVVWCYNQWQPRYEEIRRDLQHKIEFVEGVPELSEDLHEINPSKHTIIVLDDLMAQATDSPMVSKLFTQGRHRNASVILLLQNMFPKGKYNTDISRNATYKVLFRSPGDRKQIDIMAEQTFAKDRPRFMQAYKQETDRPYGYIVVDNHPRTTSEQQVVANVFGDCYSYPHITSTASPPSHPRVEPLPPPLPEKPVTRKRKASVMNKSEVRLSKKRKPSDRRVRKRKAVPVKKPRKQPVYDSSDDEMIIAPKTRIAMEQEGEDSDSDNEEEEQLGVDEDDDDNVSPEQATLKHAFYNPHLYRPMRCGYRAGGFGPRPLGY